MLPRSLVTMSVSRLSTNCLQYLEGVLDQLSVNPPESCRHELGVLAEDESYDQNEAAALGSLDGWRSAVSEGVGSNTWLLALNIVLFFPMLSGLRRCFRQNIARRERKQR